ncbi:hypothetical protein [Streptomyces flaveus]|uniref:Uncharacterized protein n=1 Tax=Streptomyces flaveus TaxID=66370 RepID=A0A917RCG1_9ACTN|nr:hypothetical protein [Streptomyces flaveus]GGL01174.1 hypothetical protein GCM10010094_72380 [Streptomyces flaveus]
MLFEAKGYIGAAKLLAAVVEEVPEQTGPRLLAEPWMRMAAAFSGEFPGDD